MLKKYNLRKKGHAQHQTYALGIKEVGILFYFTGVWKFKYIHIFFFLFALRMNDIISLLGLLIQVHHIGYPVGPDLCWYFSDNCSLSDFYCLCFSSMPFWLSLLPYPLKVYNDAFYFKNLSFIRVKVTCLSKEKYYVLRISLGLLVSISYKFDEMKPHKI